MATRRGAACLLAACLYPDFAAADDAPLSAIDWLSDSVGDAVAVAPQDPEAPLASPPAEIAVLPLDAPVPDSAGLIDAAALGLDPGLWGRSSAGDLAAALARIPGGAEVPPSLRRFLARLMQARLDPPIDAAVDDTFFLARVDRLLAAGRLDAAKALIEATGTTEQERFRRYFDIALLTGDATRACELIEETPELSPTYPARIFCLARLGQWDVAALTLGNAETLGILSEADDRLLLHFLDPELFEGEPLPDAPRHPSPLVFRLYEAVGERIPTEPLPVAFAAADLTDTVGWKTRLRAAERLAAAGAMPVEDLLAVYTERAPSASGGIWERVEAVTRLTRALEDGDAEAAAAALGPAWQAAEAAGFAPGFAAWAAPRLAEADLTGPAAHDAFEIALLARDPGLAARFARTSAEDRFLLALARGERSQPPDADPLGRAVLRGLSAIAPGSPYDTLIGDDRRGEALLRALEQLADGAAGNPEATARSLALLRALGLEALARQIAVELVLEEGAA